MREFGIYSHIQLDNLNDCNPREIVLFIAQLYQNLPHFNPKETIIFSCILNDEYSKEIYLTNNTNKRIEYSIRREGSEDFIYKTKGEIKIEPGQSIPFTILFKSRIFESVEGKLFFINRTDGMLFQAAPLVYILRSKITERRSLGNLYVVKNSLYKKLTFDISIKNPFKEKGDFEIALKISKIQGNNKNKRILDKNKQDKSKNEPFYEVFFLKADEKRNFKLEAEQTRNLTLNFLPIDMNTYECNIIFLDKKTGEFQYTVQGVGELPDFSEKYDFECTVEEHKELIIELRPNNVLFDKAAIQLNRLDVSNITQDDLGNKRGLTRCLFFVESNKQYFLVDPKINLDVVLNYTAANISKVLTNNIASSNLINPTIPNTNKASNAKLNNITTGISQNINFSKSLLNVRQSTENQPSPRDDNFANNLAILNSLNNISTNQAETQVSSTQVVQKASQSDNRLIIKFFSKTCSIYEGEITLRNIDKPLDIRVLKISVLVKPKNIYGTIEFICPIGQEIVQTIPFYNGSDKEWFLKIELIKNSLNYFYVDQDKKIPKKSTENITLKFKPSEMKESRGLLAITNTTTKEKYEYTLVGIVDEPLAKENFNFKIKVREVKEQKIVLDNNTNQPITYRIETDLSDILSGDPIVKIPANSTIGYKIIIKPLLAKTYFGKISFINDTNKSYIWYTIKVETIKPDVIPIENIIEMKCLIRKVIFVEFDFNNPINKNVIFKIEYLGEYVFGEKEFRLEAGKSGKYPLYFAPLREGKFKGKLHIYSEVIGEQYFDLNLISEKNPIITPPVIKAELGKCSDTMVILENPINEVVEVTPLIENKTIVEVIPDKILLSAYSAKEVILRYTPSLLETEESCIVKFESNKIGNWEYHLYGKGCIPSKMPKTIINTYVGGIISGVITFKNPLGKQQRDNNYFNIELKSEELPSAFALIKKDKNTSNIIQIEPLSTYQIFFSFNPMKLAKYFAEIHVSASKTLSWVFPIEGITEVKSKGICYFFKSKAKKPYETKILLDLSDISNIDIRKEKFDFIIKCKDEKYSTLIAKVLTIELNDIKYDYTSEVKKLHKLDLYVKFYPLRPFKTECELIVSKKSGGQWIYDISLEALDSDPDDILYIQSSLNKIAELSFKLNNIFTRNADFISYFSHDSSAEFSIIPKEGILKEAGKAGTNFIISYLPIEYGKVKIAKLIIETDEVQWLFEIRGSHLEYKLPEIKQSELMKPTESALSRYELVRQSLTKMNKLKEKEKGFKDLRRKSRSNSS